jgi:hypothetical protein
MYKGIETQPSCARAWVAACNEIMKTGDEGYNVVIDVADPVTHGDEDHEVISLVDKFLKAHKKPYPIISVANTIFPHSLLEAPCLSQNSPTDSAEEAIVGLCSIVAAFILRRRRS